MQKNSLKIEKIIKKLKKQAKNGVFEENQKIVCCCVARNSGDGEVIVRSNR